MKRTIVLKKARKIRRIGAAIIDLLVVLVIFIAMFLIVDPIVTSSKKYQENLKQHSDILVSSGLFEYGTDGISSVYISKDIDRKITVFLNEHSDGGLSYYNGLKDKSELFNVVDGVYTFKVEVNEQTQKKFYDLALQDVTSSTYFNEYLLTFENAEEVGAYLQSISVVKIMIPLFLAMLSYYLAMPLIRKDHNTFGKLMFKLRIYSKKGGLEPSKVQILIRQLIYVFFEIMISIYTMFMFYGLPLPLVVSLCMVLFTASSITFHDLCCSTFVVEDEVVANNTSESDKLYLTIIEDDKKEDK